MDNNQQAVANDFYCDDLRLAQECKIAFLKIQSLHFAIRTPEIGRSYVSEAVSMIKYAFFNYTTIQYIMESEGELKLN